MAITVKDRWDGRGATTDEKGVRTLKRSWVVSTDNDVTGEPDVIDAVIAHDATAALYASHPAWSAALCRQLTAAPYGGPRVWLVEAAYSSASFEAKGDGSGVSSGGSPNSSSPNLNQSNETPADQRPPTIQINRKEVTEVLERDAVTDDRVVNTVGDPFDPLPEVFRSHHLITFKFHVTPAQLAWAVRSKWMDSINAEPVVILGKTYPRYTLRCVEYAVDTVWENGGAGLAFFFALTVQAEYDPKTWVLQILNTGRRKLVGDLGGGDPLNPPRKVNITDKNGAPVDDPVPLTESGRPVEPGEAYFYVTANGYIPYDWRGTPTPPLAATIFDPLGICGR